MAEDSWLEVWQQTLVVRKRFRPIEARMSEPGNPTKPGERLDRQRRWLVAAADHPVPYLHHVDVDGLTLTTRFAGSATALSPLRPPVESALLLAAVARALGRLHRAGLVHGKLTGDHIVVDGPRFVLCSPSGLPAEPSVDVAAFEPLMALLCHRWEIGGRVSRSVIDHWRATGAEAATGTLSADRLATRLASLTAPTGRRWSFRSPAVVARSRRR